MANVNGLGHVNSTDTAYVVKQPQSQQAQSLNEKIVKELTRKTEPSPNSVDINHNQEAEAPSDGLTTDEYIIMNLYLENLDKIADKAALNEMLSSVPNKIMSSPEFQEALKAKNSEIM